MDTVSTAPHEAPGATPVSVSWREPPGMIGLSLLNFLLGLITFGIYYFWGKTEVRRRLWNAVRVNGDPLEYTGTGKELLLGFLLVFLLLVLPTTLYVVAGVILFGPQGPLLDLFMLPLYVAGAYLFGVAVFRARRYRLRRTRWRGIRGTMTGSPWRFGWTWLITAVIVLLSLGLATPWRNVTLARRLTNASRFGTQRFALIATAGPLYGLFLPFWLIVAMALGGFGYAIYSLFLGGAPLTGTATATASIAGLLSIPLFVRYKVREMNYIAGHTTFGDVRFALTARTGSLIGLYVGNWLIYVLSFGILVPVVQTRLMRYFVTRLSVNGTLDAAAIRPPADRLEKTGEGLAESFDIDAF